MLTRRPRKRPGKPSSGFTLVELLVVITVIAILMAILIPTIRGIFVRTDEFEREQEMAQFEMAIAKFKTQFGFTPPDFTRINGPQDMLPYLAKISANHQELSPDPIETSKTRLEVWWERVGVQIKARGHETALWFWLSQLRDNSQFPLTASRDPDNLSLVIDEERVFFEFDQGRLHKIGEATYPQNSPAPYAIMHYEQAGGGGAPYIYFDHTGYGLSGYEVIEDGESRGLVAPYRQPVRGQPPENWPYFGAESYQIVAAGDISPWADEPHFGNIDNPDEDELDDLRDANDLLYRDPTVRTQWGNVTNFSSGPIETMDVVSSN